MSTKIHNGVRVPLARLNEFLEAVAKITVEHAAVDIFRMINHQVPPEKVDAWIKEDIDPERYEGYSPDEQTMARCRIVYLRLAGFFGAGAEDQNIWNLYNKQAGWSLFIHGRYVYGWPWENTSRRFPRKCGRLTGFSTTAIGTVPISPRRLHPENGNLAGKPGIRS